MRLAEEETNKEVEERIRRRYKGDPKCHTQIQISSLQSQTQMID